VIHVHFEFTTGDANELLDRTLPALSSLC
jgi:hypothetical protein